jgi:NDP-sugar pyrophosphorylase family protein
MSEVEAIILAGGMGTRLRSVVSDRPKVMASVADRPFLTRLFDQLLSAQITEAVVSTGYMAEQLEEAIGDSYKALRIRYSREARPLGTGGGVRLALEKTASDPVFVLNGDSFCAVDLREFCRYHRAKGARASVVLTRVEDTSRFGQVKIDERGSVVEFVEKGAAKSTGWINAGIYCLNRDVIEPLPPGKAISLERDVFPGLIQAGLFGFPGGGEFIDIGTPESYKKAQAFSFETPE